MIPGARTPDSTPAGLASPALHRPPRDFPPPVPSERILLATPPTVGSGHAEGWMHVLFPVVGSLSMVAFALAYGNKIFLYIASGMVVLALVYAIAMRSGQKRSGKKSARRQRRRYREYLVAQERAIADVADVQVAAATRRHPDPPELRDLATTREHLWERRPSDADFLAVRIGRGPVAHAGRPKLDVGGNPLAEYEQALVDEAQRLVDRWRTIGDVPVAIGLTAAPVVSVVGPRDRARSCVRAMVAQLAVAHAPTDVRFAVSHDDAAQDWEWLKWLPHARSDGGGEGALPRLALASSTEELSALLDEQVSPRVEQLRMLSETKIFGEPETLTAPFLVLVVDGIRPGDARARLPLLREALGRAKALRVVVVCIVDDAAYEPAEVVARLRLAERGPATIEETGPTGYVQGGVRVDDADAADAEELARTLAPLRLAEDARSGALDPRDGLLSLLGVPSIDALDPAAEWRGRPRSLALRATIGVNAAGERLELDLKQAAEGGMGPHGLIIGATGSGKSELLRTLVMSLALAHSPEELAFVFVDFKGGAAFAELETLPHTAGMITNLQSDLRMVDRMHDALFGEQERRQQLLRDAGNIDDVIAYRRLREREPSRPPLPDLLVVIDEFGELLAARPEYIDLFVAIGRVGRSLGIHLLFSSQRFDEGRLRGLESHLRYRVCLRTFSAAESKGVIDTADAYLLPSEPGLGYLKVDTTVYERFRATMVTEPRATGAGHEAHRTLVVPFAPGAARAGAGAGARAPGASGDRAADDLRRIARCLRDAHTGPVHQVWCPPLPAALALDELPADAFWARTAPASSLHATIGVVDLPKEQRTRPLELDFAGTAGHAAVVGAPQSGKSTLLRTLVLGLAREHTPEEVQIYAIDLGGGLLRALGDLPHVAAVAGKADRELVLRIVARAKGAIAERQEAFSRLGLDSMADVHARRAAGLEAPCGDLFLVIDGWANLRRDFEDLDLEIEELLTSGLTYGVHVVIAAGRWGEMRPSVSDALGTRLELRISDSLDSEIDRKAAARLPADAPGRGLVEGGLEFQAALPRLDGRRDTDDLGTAIAAAARGIAARWEGPPAAPVRVLPRRLEREELPPFADLGVALGVEEERLEAVGVDFRGPDPHMVVLGDGESGRTNALRAIVEALAEAHVPAGLAVTVLDPRRTLGDLARLPHVTGYAATQTLMLEAVDGLVDALQKRSDAIDGGLPADGPSYFLVVDDYDLLAGPENPLKGLTSAIAHGRDLDFHVVIARRVAGLSRASFEPFFQALQELRTQGLLLSGDRSEGPVLDGYRASEQPPGRGLLVRRGKAVSVQTVLAPARSEQPAAARIQTDALQRAGDPL